MIRRNVQRPLKQSYRSNLASSNFLWRCLVMESTAWNKRLHNIVRYQTEQTFMFYSWFYWSYINKHALFLIAIETVKSIWRFSLMNDARVLIFFPQASLIQLYCVVLKQCLVTWKLHIGRWTWASCIFRSRKHRWTADWSRFRKALWRSTRVAFAFLAVWNHLVVKWKCVRFVHMILTIEHRIGFVWRCCETFLHELILHDEFKLFLSVFWCAHNEFSRCYGWKTRI